MQAVRASLHHKTPQMWWEVFNPDLKQFKIEFSITHAVCCFLLLIQRVWSTLLPAVNCYSRQDDEDRNPLRDFSKRVSCLWYASFHNKARMSGQDMKGRRHHEWVSFVIPPMSSTSLCVWLQSYVDILFSPASTLLGHSFERQAMLKVTVDHAYRSGGIKSQCETSQKHNLTVVCESHV